MPLCIRPTSLNFETHVTLQIIQAFDHPLSVSRWGNLGLQLQVHLFSFGCSRPIYRHQVEADIVCHVCFMAPKPISPWIMGGETWFFHQNTLFVGIFFWEIGLFVVPPGPPQTSVRFRGWVFNHFQNMKLKVSKSSKNFASRSNCGSRLTPYFYPLCNARQIFANVEQLPRILLAAWFLGFNLTLS